MPPKVESTLTWMFLTFLGGCQSQEAIDTYLKLTDMESGDGELSIGCSIKRLSSTYVGKQTDQVHYLASFQLDYANTTRPGVVSRRAARLWTESPLDTTPEDQVSPGDGGDGGVLQAERLWGANMNLNLVQLDPTNCPLSSPAMDGSPSERPLNLSSYSGLVFWAQAKGAPYPWPPDAGGANHNMEHRIRVLVRDRFSDPGGHLCDADASGITNTANKCWNAFSTTLDLSQSFSRYDVAFSTMRRDPTWGYRPDGDELDLTNVYSIVFEVGAAKCAADPNAECAQEYPPLAFDIWIDDVYLVKRK